MSINKNEITKEMLKDIIQKIDRYKDFTVLNSPSVFCNLFADRTIPCVQIHSIQQCDDGIVGFCGVFKWEDNKITPLDGDSYNETMDIYGYSWFMHDGEKCLDVLVKDNW